MSRERGQKARRGGGLTWEWIGFRIRFWIAAKNAKRRKKGNTMLNYGLLEHRLPQKASCAFFLLRLFAFFAAMLGVWARRSRAGIAL